MASNWPGPMAFEVVLTAKFFEQIVNTGLQCVEYAIETNHMWTLGSKSAKKKWILNNQNYHKNHLWKSVLHLNT